MKIEFKITDDSGRSYHGAADLLAVTTDVRATIAPDHRETLKTVEKLSLPDRLIQLREVGFFQQPRTAAEAHSKLLENYHCVLDRVQMALLRLLRRRQLRKTTRTINDQEQIAYVW
jgi:hypothetical protein